MYVITGKRKEDSMIPYVEFNYEWKEAMSDSEPISVRIK